MEHFDTHSSYYSPHIIYLAIGRYEYKNEFLGLIMGIVFLTMG